MKDFKLEKIELFKTEMDKRNIHYRELPNGHFKIDNMNYWATTEKFYDANTGKKFVGFNQFLSLMDWRKNNVL